MSLRDDITALVANIESPEDPGGQAGLQETFERLSARMQALRGRADLAGRMWEARRPIERAFAAKWRATLGRSRDGVLLRLRSAAGGRVASNAETSIVDLLFDLESFADDVAREMRAVHTVAIAAAHMEMLEELAGDGVEIDDAWTMAPQAARRFLDVRENRMKDAAAEVHRKIGDELKAGIDEGETMDELADRVRVAFRDADESRAKTIATTETGAAYGVARHDAMEQAGIKFKKWVTARDERVRHTHMDIDGEVVPLEENFSNGCAFPGDPEGPAAEVINCRCVQTPVLDAEGNR